MKDMKNHAGNYDDIAPYDVKKVECMSFRQKL